MKKITYNEANYIMRRTKPHKLERILCYWVIQMENLNSGWIRCYMKWWAYILFFIPAHVLVFICRLWDGGLKEFRIEPRRIHGYSIAGLTIDGENTEFGRLKLVWEKYNEESN